MKNEQNGRIKSKRSKIAAILALFVTLITTLAVGPNIGNITTYLKSLKASGDTPSHHKIVEKNGEGPNGDGTYKISLDVTGDAEKKAQKANVIVVFDSSSSMNYETGNTETTYTETTSTATNNEYYGKENEEYFPLRQEEAYKAFTGTPSGNGTYYGYYNNQYVRVYYNNGRYYRTRSYSWGGYNYSNQYNGTVYQREYHYYKEDNTEYTGQRYIKEEGNQTRLQAAKKATNDLAKALLSNNGKNGNPNDTIQIALVDFANTAEVAQTPTTDYSSFETVVNNRDAGNWNRGTNWEAGFRSAQTVNFNDNDPTYVIFVSDGNPTYYLQDPNNTTRGGSGQEDADNIEISYNQAVPAAKAVVNSNKTLYTIGIYGNVDRMESITTEAGAPAANYFSAENTAALREAFATILEQIEMSGIGSVEIQDGTTENVKTSTGTMHMLTVSNKFEYTISFPIENGKVMINTNEATLNEAQNQITWGNNKKLDGKVVDGQFVYTWTGPNDLYNFNPPAATNENSEVKWDLSQCGVLVNGATYTVSFDVWPSQETYDLIAELKNGKPYSEVDANVRNYLSEDFVLKTNTGASLTYTDTRVPASNTVPYEDPGSAPLEASQINVEKVWIDGDKTIDDPKDENGKPFELTMNLIQDGKEMTDTSITVSKELGWSQSKYIATGLMKTHETSSGTGTLEVLETGHDYSLKEPEAISYHWELTIETAHPMIINGTLTTLVEVKGNDIPSAANNLEDDSYTTVDGVKYYKFNEGKIYKTKAEGVQAGLTAYNNRKSYLEFAKKVTGDAPEGKEFNFSFNIHNVINKNIEDDDDIWFSVYDTKAGKTVMELDTNAKAEIKNGEATGYYSIANDSNITVKLQDGWNLRVINLGTGSTYTINEVGIATENTIDALNASDPKYFMITDIDVTTSLPEEEAAEYKPTIEKTSISGSITKVNTSYSVVFTNDYPGTYLTVNKEWIGTAKDKVNVTLYQSIDGADATATDKTAELNAENEWTYTFEGLPLREKGTDKPITYSVKEDEIKGYKTTIEQDGKDKHIWTITNAEQTTATVVKEWNDDDNRDGLRKPVEMTLTANGNPTNTKVTLAEDKQWTATVEGLDKYDSEGNEITYSWTETVPTGYVQESKTYDEETRTTTIKNKHDPELVNIKVTKNWDDNNNQDGKRPTSLTVTLKGDGATIETTELKPEGWTHTFEGLFKYSKTNPGQEIKYTVEETLVGNEYTYVKTTSEDITDNEGKVIGTSYTIENTHTIAKTNICVNKVWNDANNQDGYRPTGLKVNLIAQAGEEEAEVVDFYTLVSGENWTHTFENIDVYKNGQIITYSLEEELDNASKNYYTQGETTSEELKDEEGKVIGTSYTLNNNHEVEKTIRTIVKDWDDADDQDGKRPESITFTLTGNGESKGTVTLSEDNGWTGTINNLDVKANGQNIQYIWSEPDIEGYELSNTQREDIKDENDKVIGEKITLTNTHDIEKTEATVKKVWDDANNQDGKRPESLEVTLSDGQKVTLNEANSWTATITGLDKYADGEEIEYTWSETNTTGYTLTDSSVNGTITTLTNKHEPEKIDLEVKKVWNDNNNQDGKRPEKILVQLLADGTKVDEATLQGNEWSAKFSSKPKYANGNEINYTVTETDINGKTIAEYELTDNKKSATETGSYIELTNTHTIAKTNICVTKDWVDNNDQDGYRPDDIIINVLAETDEKAAHVVATYKLSANDEVKENSWSYTFENLDVYDTGLPITYTIEEVNVNDQYTSKIEGNAEEGFTVTNTHETDKISIPVEKDWQDNNNQDGKRKDVIVTLYADDVKTDKTVTLTEENGYKATFENLEKFKKENGKGGVEIKYTVNEEKENIPEGYELTKISGDMVNGFIIQNTHTPEKRDITVNKEWDMSENIYEFSTPESIEIILYANGDEQEKQTVTPDEEGNWTYTFTELDKYKDGELITYTIDETPIVDYKTSVDNEKFIITNKYTPETGEVSGKKTWTDNNDQDGKRPDKIEIDLVATVEGKEVYRTTKEVVKPTEEESNTWSYTFDGLPIYDNGKEITWIAEEHEVEGYERTDETITLDITNKHTPETISYSVVKVWEDEKNNDGKRPEKVTIRLYNDKDEEVKSIELTEENGWKGEFTELPKFRDHGTPIKYYIKEDSVKDYEEPIIEKTGDYSSQVTNTHNKEKINIHITKTWNDKNNQYSLRPEQIIVDIYANKEIYETITITAKDNWEYTLEGLDKYLDGEEIVYSVKERPVDQYIVAYNKYNIINNLDETGIEIIPPDTGINSEEKNIGVLYLLVAIISILTLGFKKIYE